MQPFGSPTAFPLNVPTGETTQGEPNFSDNLIPAGTTSTQTAVQLGNPGSGKLVLVVKVTAGAGSLTVAINATTASGFTYNLLTSAALASGSTTALSVGPGLPVTANVSANAVVPAYLLVTATVTTSATYGIDYEFAP
jgi:hypothetical protein